jgi:hypothetical protein
MSLELDLGIAQVPSDVRVGDVFWNREKYNQCKQNGQKHREAAQPPEQLRRPLERSSILGFNYAGNHANGEFLPLETTCVARYYPTYRTKLPNLDLSKCYQGTESTIERDSRFSRSWGP